MREFFLSTRSLACVRDDNKGTLSVGEAERNPERDAFLCAVIRIPACIGKKALPFLGITVYKGWPVAHRITVTYSIPLVLGRSSADRCAFLFLGRAGILFHPILPSRVGSWAYPLFSGVHLLAPSMASGMERGDSHLFRISPGFFSRTFHRYYGGIPANAQR